MLEVRYPLIWTLGFTLMQNLLRLPVMKFRITFNLKGMRPVNQLQNYDLSC
jgi:hypothetical protein